MPLSKFTFGQLSDRHCLGQKSGGRKHVEAIAHRDVPSQMFVVNVLIGPHTQLFTLGN